MYTRIYAGRGRALVDRSLSTGPPDQFTHGKEKGNMKNTRRFNLPTQAARRRSALGLAHVRRRAAASDELEYLRSEWGRLGSQCYRRSMS